MCIGVDTIKLLSLFFLLFLSNARAIEYIDVQGLYPDVSEDEIPEINLREFYQKKDCLNKSQNDFDPSKYETANIRKEVFFRENERIKIEVKEAKLINTKLHLKLEGTIRYRKHIAPVLIGCADQMSSKFVYDYKFNKETNIYETRAVEDFKTEFQIKGLGDEINFSSLGSVYIYDLEMNLFSVNLSTLKGLSEISLICKSCMSPNKEIKIKHNLFQVKDAEIKKLNNSELVRRKQFENELAIKKANEERDKSEYVNNTKNNCAALGFDKDSPKFRACVMELMK